MTDDREPTDDLELMKIGKTIDCRVRCLLVYCARCELQVLRVERDDRDRNPSISMANGSLWTLGGLHVSVQGARNFREYRPPEGMSLHRTFSWRCAHGHADTRRLVAFLKAWPQHDPTRGVHPPRVVRLKLGVDV